MTFLTYIDRVERELRTKRVVGVELCSEFSSLPVEMQLAFGKAIEFSGCGGVTVDTHSETGMIREPLRIQAVRLMFFRMFVDTGEPRWSSFMLERMVATAMGVPGAGVNDVLRALFGLLSENTFLTATMGTFLKQVVVLCFTSYRKSYDSADFSWLLQVPNEELTPAQAYLLLHCSPPSILPASRKSILKALEHTSYKTEASRILADDDFK